MKKIIIILTILVLLITNFTTVFLLLNTRREKVTNPYPLVDFSRSFIAQENFIVNLVPLRKDLEKLVSKNTELKISAYIEFLNTGANININLETPIWPASLIKIPVVMAAAKKINKGEWKWENQLVLFEQDKDSGFGDLYKKPVGTRLTIEELVRESLVNSDNTANSILVRNIDLDLMDQIENEVGIDLYDKDKKIRVKDYARIFRSLYTSSFLKRESSEKILEFLGNSKTNDYLSRGLPQNVKLAHKLARNREQKVFGDAGIVYIPDRPYFIGVMIEVKDLKNEKKATHLLAEFSQKTYQYLNNYGKKN